MMDLLKDKNRFNLPDTASVVREYRLPNSWLVLIMEPETQYLAGRIYVRRHYHLQHINTNNRRMKFGYSAYYLKNKAIAIQWFSKVRNDIKNGVLPEKGVS